MKQPCRPARFLASVTHEREAALCASLGADIIDAKDPAAGALGALDPARVRAIRACVPAHVPVSATVGDPCADVEAMAQRVEAMAATGVDFVKVGLSAEASPATALHRLGRAATGPARLVGVLLADCGIDLDLIAAAKDADFVGVMLDTSDKTRGALPDIVPEETLRAFIAAARAAGLFAGLAGSLHAGHVVSLMALAPDVLGFRGGLCRDGERVRAIDADAVRAVRLALGDPAALEPRGGAHHDGIARLQPEEAL